MEFKKKHPCTQCIFLTTKESTLAKHMKRHQNITEGHQASNSSSPPSSDTLPVLGSAKSKLPTFFKSTISEETNPSSQNIVADEENNSKRIFNVYSEEFKNLRRKNLTKAHNNIISDSNTKSNKHENNVIGEEEEKNSDCESGENVDPQVQTSIFASKSAYRKVRRTEFVTGDSKFQCQECERIFNSQPALWYHRKSKHEGVKYPCNKCDYQAQTQSNLRVHMQSKHKGVRYACNQCDKQFTTQQHLTRHIKSQHEGVKYACNQCDYEGSKDALSFHLKKRHSMTQ